jgi:hypothetical protein
MQLYSLNYVSRAQAPAEGPEIEAIREVALSRNAAENVTGVLYLDGKLFFQVLEGHETCVRRLLASIRADSRHSDLRVIQQGPLLRRRFGRWSMKFVDAASLPADAPRPRFADFRRPTAEAMTKALERTS